MNKTKTIQWSVHLIPGTIRHGKEIIRWVKQLHTLKTGKATNSLYEIKCLTCDYKYLCASNKFRITCGNCLLTEKNKHKLNNNGRVNTISYNKLLENQKLNQQQITLYQDSKTECKRCKYFDDNDLFKTDFLSKIECPFTRLILCTNSDFNLNTDNFTINLGTDYKYWFKDFIDTKLEELEKISNLLMNKPYPIIFNGD